MPKPLRKAATWATYDNRPSGKQNMDLKESEEVAKTRREKKRIADTQSGLETYSEYLEHGRKKQKTRPFIKGTGTVRRKRIMLGDLNFDIALVIFTHLGLSSATCLGLSCPKFYAYFKIFHPAPIPLQAFASGSSCDIAHAIRSWSGLDNSRCCMLKTVLQFLNNDVDDHEKKTALLDCYDDQRSSQKFRKIYQLPNPIMMGPEWYSAAFKIIERDFRYTEQRSESVFDWQYRLEDFRVFSRYKDHWNKVVLRLGLQKAGNLLYVLTLSRSATAGFVQAVLKEALGSWRANEII